MGRSISGHTLGRPWKKGAEATFSCRRNRQPRPEDAGLHCGATEDRRRSRRSTCVMSICRLGITVWHFAHQKAIWSIAMLSCSGRSLRWAVGFGEGELTTWLVGEGAELPGQRRDVHRGQAAPFLPHDATPRVAPSLPQRLPLQRRHCRTKSRTVWRGMIKVDPDAQKTDGYQRNDNLLLSRKTPGPMRFPVWRSRPTMSDLHARINDRTRRR